MVKLSAKTIRLALKKRRILRSGLFDAEFYLDKYPDVAAAGHDPLEHFIRNGGREARSPSPMFDGPLYVMSNPQARHADNILLDWLRERERGTRVPPKPLNGPAAPAAHHAPAEVARPTAVTDDDYELVRDSGLFDRQYVRSAYPDLAHPGMDLLRHYLEFGWRENRNPSARFDSHYVATALIGQSTDGKSGENPLLAYLKSKKLRDASPLPPGSVLLQPGTKARKAKKQHKIAIHIHLHYSEMIQQFLPYLRMIPFSFDLLLSTPTEADARFLTNYIAANFSECGKVVVRVTPNRGRDIAPFLIGFGDLMSDYDYVCHLHSKRSPHTSFGQHWLEWVLRGLFGEEWITRSVFDHMDAHPDCMVMFPDNYFEIKKFATWAGNEGRLHALLKRFGISRAKLPEFANFPAGSMAWFRGSFVHQLSQNLSLDDFEEEKGQVEGTLAHILERAIPFLACAQSKQICRYYLETIPPSVPAFTYHGASPESEPAGDLWMRDTPAIARHRPLELAPLTRIFNEDCLNISWVIPDFGLGAGGHMTIFRIVQYLEQFGHRQTLWIQNARNHASPLAAKRAISSNYRKLGPNVNVRFLPDDIRELSGDAIIATDCWTAFPVSRATNFKERFYFIQDFEPYFHPMGDNFMLAEATYSLGFSALCAGKWLLGKAQEYGMWARAWNLGVDHEFYYPNGSPKRPQPVGAPKTIAFYSRSYTPRRAVALGIAAFEELARRRSDFSVHLFGEDGAGRRYSFPHVQHGIMSPAQLGELYREADLGVSFSTTNYSLVPLEMMACRLPVVEIDAPSARVAFPAGTVAFAGPTPIAVADAIEKLLDDADARAVQVGEADEFVKELDWEDSARAVEAAIKERLNEKGFKPVDVAKLGAPLVKRSRKASVIIPTYNGGALFHRVLEAVANQDTDFEYDVFVIDSSSSDGTGEFAAKFGSRVRCETIDQRDFQHGRTRNQAIAATDGDVVAVLTQDALPYDRNWLRELVAPFAEPGVAGAIGRHYAYPEHNGLVARDLNLMFNRFRDMGPMFSLDDQLPGFMRPGSLHWQTTLHFYSDNNSAMRRTVWKELPYPEVDWGEDQVWCWEMLKLGLKKAYADKAVVWHSHDLDQNEQIKVASSEAEMYARYFGLHLASEEFDPAHLDHLRHDAMLYATSAGIPVDQVEAYVRAARWTRRGHLIGAAKAELKE